MDQSESIPAGAEVHFDADESYLLAEQIAERTCLRAEFPKAALRG
jgi:hypothetical protein